MNYSRLSKQGKQILISWAIIAIVFFIIGMLIGMMCITSDAVDVIPETNEATETPATSETPEITQKPETLTPETTAEAIPEYTYTSLGEFRLTAYCACEKCCGYWATVRPLDEDGNPIVYTANGSIAKQGVTVAADTNVLPFGTKLRIDGHEYTVQDRGGAINGNRVDIYFESHEEALQFGVQYKEIFIKEKTQ